MPSVQTPSLALDMNEGHRTCKFPVKALLLLLFLCISPLAEAGVVPVPGASFGNMNIKVTSLKEEHFRTTIQQQYDFSCGSAALATLLTFHYEDPVSEADVFKAMYDIGDKEKIHREGFSLLDMKNYLERKGYQADGFRISLERLKDLGVPAVVLVNHKGFKHFVIIKGVTDKEVLLGDPALGSRVVQRSEFEPMWNGLVFLVRNKKEVAMLHFNRRQDWHVKEKGPLAMALVNGQFMNLTLYLPVRTGL